MMSYNSNQEHPNDIVYLNTGFKGISDTSAARTVLAETLIQRSGTIVDDVSDYYVAVMRLVFTTNNPIIIAPCTSAAFTADGVTTDWSLTVRQTTLTGIPTYIYGRGWVKLLRSNPILGLTSQPTDLYTAVWSPQEWEEMLNNAVAEATADAITNGADPALLEVPIFSLIPGTGRLQLTVTQFDPWDQVSRVSGSGAKVFDLFTNWAMQIAMGGWGFRARVLPNAPLSANGDDYLFIIRSNGYNYTPANAAGIAALLPTAPSAGTQLVIQQMFATQKMPGIVSIAVESSIPIVQEFTPGDDGKGARAILTDFAPDTSNVMIGEAQTLLTYNGSIGDARWIKMKGGGPLSTFSLRATTTDWLGTVRTLNLTGPAEKFEIKLAFAPRYIVESWMSDPPS